MKTLIKFSLLLIALVMLLITPAKAGDIPGESWVMALGGAGATTTGDDSQTAFGAEIDLGRTGHLLLPIQSGLRQTFSYVSSSDERDRAALFSSTLYLDATLLSYKKVDLFAGGNIGITYGNDIEPQWEAAPEAGLRWWIKEDVAIVGRVEFPYRIDDDDGSGGWKDTLEYFVGLQVTF